MKNISKLKQFIISPAGIAIALVWTVYVVLTFLIPQTATSREKFAIAKTTLVFIQLTVALPYLILWFCTGYGSWLFRRVTDPARLTFSKYFSWALGFLLCGMMLQTVVSTARSLLVADQSWWPALTILLNLSYTFFPVIGYWLMLRGLQATRAAADTGKLFSKSHFLQAIAGALVVAMPFIWFVFTNANRLIPFAPDTPATYYLSDPLIIILIVIPSVLSWIVGLLVAFKASDSLEFTERKENADFFNGIFLVVLSSIILQALISIGTERLFNLGLGVILLLIYLFILMQLVGYISLAQNARKLLD